MPPASQPSATLGSERPSLPLERDRATLREAIAEMGTQDWLVLAYHSILVLEVLVAPRQPDWARALFDMSWIWLAFVTGLVLVRGRLLTQRAEAIVYRVIMLLTVEATYFCFRRVLPVINPGSLDRQLYELDMSLFGIEPSLAAQPLVTGPLTEWFSFFYFGYFFVICAHIVPIVFFSRDRQAQYEFTFGVLLTFCVGHLTYTIVPGFGPGTAMASSFSTPLPRGPWFDTVWNTVETGGALKDIFPSIHTAIPTFITLWSFRQRARMPYRYTWPCVAFVSANVVLATMYLRWHYLIDVVAGFALGTLAFVACVPVTVRELTRRDEHGLRPVWPDY